MEKQGMDRRRRFLRAGLLIFIPLLLFLPAVFHEAGLRADEGESGEEFTETAPALLELRIETSPANPSVNNPWSIFILVNHPSPSELNVKPPRFPATLILERVRTDTRLIRTETPPSQEISSDAPVERWTRVEFLFTPQRAGLITLEPFEITAPGRYAATGETSVRIRENAAAVRRYEPRFRWTGPGPSVSPGERAELLLELTGWDPEQEMPNGFFQGRAPRNAIIEAVDNPPATAGEANGRYIINIIALEGDSVVLEPFSFQSGAYALDVPGITVPVLPRPGNSDSPESSDDVPGPGEIPEGSVPVLSFPITREKVFPLVQGEYGRIIAGVRILWDEGRRAEALAELRRNERDSLSGPLLVSLRREMEQAMNLGFTGDERWRPMRVPLLAWLVLCIVLFSIGVIFFIFRPRPAIQKKNVTLGRRSGFKTGIILVILMGFTLILLEEGLGNFPAGRLRSRGNAVILERSPAYRVPDLKGAVNAWFGEGQPVNVGDYRGDWCYAESSDGRSGWVPREALINY